MKVSNPSDDQVNQNHNGCLLTDIEGWNTFVTESGLPDIARVLVGNKTDLADDRKVQKDKGKVSDHRCLLTEYA